MQAVQIHPIKELQAQAWQTLLKTSLDEGYDFIQKLCDEYEAGTNRFDAPGAILLGAYLNDELIAVGGVHSDPYLQTATVGRVRHVYVLPEYRRHGVGRELMLALIQHAHEHFETLTLRTPTAHGDNFYKSLGFTDEPHFDNATHWLRLSEVVSVRSRQMDILKQSCLLITGIMAAGKSTIAQHLAERLPQSVHLRGDVFRKMIVNGQAEIEPPLSDTAMAQLRLHYQIAAQVADQYCTAGFTVVYQDVIIGAMMSEMLRLYQQYPLYVVVLCPAPEIALKRDSNRHKQTYIGWTPEELDRALREETPRVGLWLDTSTLTIEQTVDTILGRIDEAKMSGGV
jgi:GNAT superfamily N-acetyltransferase/predicted kinase